MLVEDEIDPNEDWHKAHSFYFNLKCIKSIQEKKNLGGGY